jgi:hypothetical protein
VRRPLIRESLPQVTSTTMTLLLFAAVTTGMVNTTIAQDQVDAFADEQANRKLTSKTTATMSVAAMAPLTTSLSATTNMDATTSASIVTTTIATTDTTLLGAACMLPHEFQRPVASICLRHAG